MYSEPSRNVLSHGSNFFDKLSPYTAIPWLTWLEFFLKNHVIVIILRSRWWNYFRGKSNYFVIPCSKIMLWENLLWTKNKITLGQGLLSEIMKPLNQIDCKSTKSSFDSNIKQNRKKLFELENHKTFFLLRGFY